MKISYYAETDSLYIDLSSKPSTDSKEVSDGVVLDYNENGTLSGIEIDNASKKVKLDELILKNMPSDTAIINTQFD